MSLVPNPADDDALRRLHAQKARLQSLRDTARRSYTGGAAPLQTAALICSSMDELVIELLDECLKGLNPAEIEEIKSRSAVLAVGGTGRGELAPYSDVDLLFLHEKSRSAAFVAFVPRIVRECWDMGIQLGHRVATPVDALAFARTDPIFATALVEMRLLWGSGRLFESFRSRFERRVSRGRYNTFYQECCAARFEERAKFGETDRQLEPDVKRSPGGLRDIQLVRWIGYARFGTPDIDLLRRGGYISIEDADALAKSQDFLMRIRTELHFAAGKAQEILSRDEQLRLAEILGFKGTEAQRPVEQFMQQYFRHTTAVVEVVDRFVEQQRPRRWVDKVVRFVTSHRTSTFFLANAAEVFPATNCLDEVVGNPELLFQMFDLAASYGARVPPEFFAAIREACGKFTQPPSRKVSAQFLSILKAEKNLGRILRDMYSNGMLEYMLPELTGIRCLLQFNQYHAYTVDEHTFRAIEAAEGLRAADSTLGEAAREVKQKALLHLALLLHDSGKGHVEDHSILGGRLARQAAERLGLDPTQSDTLAFLVRHHLSMTMVAFRRDLHDVSQQIEFSRLVGNAEVLRLLYVHTAADMLAVGPTTFTTWKEDLLGQLFQGSLECLSGTPPGAELDVIRDSICDGLREPDNKAIGKSTQRETAEASKALKSLIDSLPPHYIAGTPVELAVQDLRIVQSLDTRPLTVTGTYDAATRSVEYRIITRDRPGSGLFSKICGTLTAKGMSILTANICTTSQQVAIDRFRVIDRDFAGDVPHYRLREVEASLREILEEKLSVEELFQRNRRMGSFIVGENGLREPPAVSIDNHASVSATVVDVFAHNARGLLYTIASGLYECGLSVTLAKITTHVDQVLDVFYVTTMDGRKLPDAELPAIEAQLLRRVVEFDNQIRGGKSF
ncbi:MAG: [protein-PII] uridylyltransferase [Planctomycetota bacterium]|nr:[protein-PII] uridylyltransferase [Planctomycetota bacterium]